MLEVKVIKDYLDHIMMSYNRYTDGELQLFFSDIVQEYIDKQTDDYDVLAYEFRKELIGYFDFFAYYMKSPLPFPYMKIPEKLPELPDIDTLKTMLEDVGLSVNMEADMVRYGLGNMIVQYANQHDKPILQYFINVVKSDIDYIESIAPDIGQDEAITLKTALIMGLDVRKYDVHKVRNFLMEDLEKVREAINDGIPFNKVLVRYREHLWNLEEAIIRSTKPHDYEYRGVVPTGIKGDDLYDPKWIESHYRSKTGATSGQAHISGYRYRGTCNEIQGRPTYNGPGPLHGKRYERIRSRTVMVLNSVYHRGDIYSINFPNIQRLDSLTPNKVVYDGDVIPDSVLGHKPSDYIYSAGLFDIVEKTHATTHIKKTDILVEQVTHYRSDENKYGKIVHGRRLKLTDTNTGKVEYVGFSKDGVDYKGYPREIVKPGQRQVTVYSVDGYTDDIAGKPQRKHSEIHPDKDGGTVARLTMTSSNGARYIIDRISDKFNVTFEVNIGARAPFIYSKGTTITGDGNYYDRATAECNSVVELLDVNIQPHSNGNIVTGVDLDPHTNTIENRITDGVTQKLVPISIFGISGLRQTDGSWWWGLRIGMEPKYIGVIGAVRPGHGDTHVMFNNFRSNYRSWAWWGIGFSHSSHSHHFHHTHRNSEVQVSILTAFGWDTARYDKG